MNEKWLNGRHFFVAEKNMEKLGVTGELLSVYSYYMMILLSESSFGFTIC